MMALNIAREDWLDICGGNVTKDGFGGQWQRIRNDVDSR